MIKFKICDKKINMFAVMVISSIGKIRKKKKMRKPKQIFLEALIFKNLLKFKIHYFNLMFMVLNYLFDVLIQYFHKYACLCVFLII